MTQLLLSLEYAETCVKLLRNLPAFYFHSSATIKTCKCIYFS